VQALAQEPFEKILLLIVRWPVLLAITVIVLMYVDSRDPVAPQVEG